jgi:GNAT superfamily N-acetyltransferase
MDDTNIRVRPARDDDQAGILAVAPRLAEGVAWRDRAEALQAGRDHGVRNLTLHAGAFNAGARAFYADLGFAEEEVRLTRPIGPEASRNGNQR